MVEQVGCMNRFLYSGSHTHNVEKPQPIKVASRVTCRKFLPSWMRVISQMSPTVGQAAVGPTQDVMNSDALYFGFDHLA